MSDKSLKDHIEIEKLLFGDFRVNVWNTNLDSMLDREYFCRGYHSALATAAKVQEDLFPELPILYYDPEKGHYIELSGLDLYGHYKFQ